MIDTANQQRLQVMTDVPFRPYFRISVEVLENACNILQENDIPYWVDHLRISFNNGPYMTVVNLGQHADPNRVQELLDAAP